MIESIPEIYQLLLVVLGAGGVAGGSTKLLMNGLGEDVKEIKTDVKEVAKAIGKHGERITAVETQSSAHDIDIRDLQRERRVS